MFVTLGGGIGGQRLEARGGNANAVNAIAGFNVDPVLRLGAGRDQNYRKCQQEPAKRRSRTATGL